MISKHYNTQINNYESIYPLYFSSYETGNGIHREETAYDKEQPEGKSHSHSDCSNEGGEDDDSGEIHVQKGSYSYTAPDGTLVSVR